MTGCAEWYRVPNVAALEGALTVDPSIENVGWAWWDGTDKPYTGVIHVKHPKKPQPIGKRLQVLGQHMKNVLLVLSCVNRVIIEQPEFWGGGSVASAGSGSLGTLTLATGYIAAVVEQMTEAEIVMVPVRAWKGTMSKAVVGSRVERVNGKIYRDHELDAVGIGFGIAGVL